MRKRVPVILNAGRYRTGLWGTSDDAGFLGGFLIEGPTGPLKIIANPGSKSSQWWEHVSVSCEGRTPTWEEMCFVKDLFWDEEEAVFQLHPPRSEYVNHHPFALHLWRHALKPIHRPPKKFVGGGA